MGGLTPLLAAYGAYATGRRQRTLDEQQREYQQAQLDLQRRQLSDTEQQNGIDPATGQPFPFTVPKNLQQIAPNNKGVMPDPSTLAVDRVNQLQGIALAALGQNRPDLYDKYQSMARDAALNAGTLAGAAYTAGGKTADAYAKAQLYQAQAAAAWDLPARARAIAAGHDQAAWARNVANILSRQEIAGYQGEVRQAIAKYAGAIMLTGKSDQDATQMAIAQLRANEQTYLQQTNPKTQLLNPDLAAQGFQTGGATFNFNLGQGNATPPAFPQVKPAWVNPNSGVDLTKAKPPPGVNKAHYAQAIAIAQQEFAKGVSLNEIRADIQALPFDPATKAAILNALGAPQGGGSQATNPFPLLP